MKELTQNEYHRSVNRVINYINKHLADPLDLEILAEIANSSEFHFHRIFKAFAGEPPSTYVTRLRLENAAQKLRTTKLTLTEIAEKTGYQNQYSLSKAFKKHFGLNPSEFRNIQTFFSSRPTNEKKENIELKPEIKEIGPKKLVYIRITGKYGAPEAYQTAWGKLWQFAKQHQLVSESTEYLGLSFDDPSITQEYHCRFYACLTTAKNIKPIGEFGVQQLDGGLYAIFTLKGPYNGLNDLYNDIYYQWLSETPYRLRNSMPFEKYLNNPDRTPENELLTEIYIPISL